MFLAIILLFDWGYFMSHCSLNGTCAVVIRDYVSDSMHKLEAGSTLSTLFRVLP